MAAHTARGTRNLVADDVTTMDYYEGRSEFGVVDPCWFESAMFRNSDWLSDPNFNMVIPKEWDQYHPHVCNCCKRGRLQDVELFRCSRCKVMLYCSKEHQRQDWEDDHKVWCNAFVKVMKTQTEANNNNAVTGRHGISTDSDINLWRRQMTETTCKIMRRLQQGATKGKGGAALVGRQPQDAFSGLSHTNYIQYAMLQPSCHNCLRPGRDAGVELVVCPHCGDVAVCKECLGMKGDTKNEEGETKKQEKEKHLDWSLFHATQDECKNHLISLCCMGMVVENGRPLCASSDTNRETIFQPNDWNEYFREKSNDFDTNLLMPFSSMSAMAPVSAFITEGLTIPLTVQHILGHHNLSILTTKKTLCIHVIGAAVTEYNWKQSWIELGRNNPQLEQIHIILIGPGLPSFDDNCVQDFNNHLLHTDEMRLNCKGAIHSLRGLYHVRHRDIPASYPPPDLRIAFQSGISDSAHAKSWTPTLHFISRGNGNCNSNGDNDNTAINGRRRIPFCITGFNHQEVVDDTHRITEEFQMKVQIPPSANPFRGMRPYLDPNREGSDFIFGNASYAIFH